MPDPIQPNKNVTKDIGARDRRAFSSFDDLATWAVDSGLASSEADVRANRRDLWPDLLFRWYAQGQVACVFAASLARRPDKARWFSAVVEGADQTADIVTAMVDQGAASGADALQLLFPGEGSANQAIELIRRLASHDRWACVDANGDAGDSLQVGLRWMPPGLEYESWALGIAPFEPMPFTRRFVGAPFLALVVRPTEPIEARAPAKIGDTGRVATHLAHMDDLLGANAELRRKWTDITRRGRSALVSPDPEARAKARVTFALPSWARSELQSILQQPAPKE